jgi:formate dehydrogenase iron-sulfur subunit
LITRIFVPQDSTVLSLGAEAVVQAIREYAHAHAHELDVVRNGSRGMFWLEPMIEIHTTAGRVAYGPVGVADVPSLFAAGFLRGAAHPLRLGDAEQIPYFKKQQRFTFVRVGRVDPASLDDYRLHGGFAGLEQALQMAPGAIVRTVTDSGLRGRGGAAFPTGIKWKTVADQVSDQKFVTCNADEGDSGTFADRMLMEGDPFTLIEGMIIAGLAVGATQGYIYLRIEYPDAARALRTAIAACYTAGYLGADVSRSGKRFDLSVRMGAGAYICGEETSMLESLEGRRGEVRVRPPLPAIQGLFAKPTIVNNVISLASVPVILERGADFYRSVGRDKSLGTVPIQLAGNIKRGGLIELPFGVPLREVLEEFGGGSASGRPLRAVQIGGPLGAYLPASQFDTLLDYESLAAIGALLGHGGIVAFDDRVHMGKMARYALEFCAIESCGKCTPCRIGSTRGVEIMDRVLRGEHVESNLNLLNELCDTMLNGSLCGLGGMTPFPVQSAMRHFAEDFEIVRH